MKIHYLSDLHLEFGKMPRDYAPPECDVVVLAGDIGVGRQGMAWAKDTFDENLPVIYVCGNHELYRRSMALYEELRAMAAATPNIKFLEADTVQVKGVNFIGATLWTDFNRDGDPTGAAVEARFGMNDFNLIENFGIQVWLDRNAYARGYIEGSLTRHRGEQCIVVTHHAPSPLSTPERLSGDSLNAAYSSRFLEELPQEIRPLLWLHGHTHETFDYFEGSTRVVCNPRGYVGHEVNPRFDIQAVVDVAS